MRILHCVGLMCIGVSLIACTPTVKLEAPDKPIEINMNIKIEQEVRIRIDKELEKEILSNPDLFGTSKKTSKK
jgi:hypothetical protein